MLSLPYMIHEPGLGSDNSNNINKTQTSINIGKKLTWNGRSVESIHAHQQQLTHDMDIYRSKMASPQYHMFLILNNCLHITIWILKCGY